MSGQSKSNLLADSQLDPSTQCMNPEPRPHIMRLLSAFTAVSILASLAYLSCRLRAIMATPRPDSTMWVVLLIEISIAVPQLLMRLSVLGDATKASKQQALSQKEISDDELPRVDIFITYCGEGIKIVLNTAKAACVQRFPPSLIRVIVLDDSHSTQLEEAILSLRNSRKHLNLYYASRNIHVTTHSKAANLNFGLCFASTLPGPAPDYISVLDVDMIPSPTWLKTVLTSLLHHPDVALVGACQRFYNISHSDPLGMTHELSNIESLIYVQNAAHESWCTGSGFVVRCAALEQIGGFPEGHLQEDFLTSLLLSAAGWKSLYVLDTLQWGLAADTMASWIKQRQRWAAGVISISQWTCSPQARQVPALKRLQGLLWGVFDTYQSFIWTVTMIVFPLAVVTGKPLLPNHQIRLLLRLAVLDFAGQSIYNYLLTLLVNFRMSLLAQFSIVWTAPVRFAVACRCILPSILGRQLPRFRPTGIPTTGDSERALRVKRMSCLTTVLWECGGLMHVFSLGFCLAGIGVSVGQVLKVFGRVSLKGEDFQLFSQPAFDAFIVRVGWPSLLLLLVTLLKNAWIPIAYGISPPPLTHTKGMLCKGDDNGVQYPTETVRREAAKRVSQSFWWSIAVFYLVVIVVSERSTSHM